jgi:hypothetical protein
MGNKKFRNRYSKGEVKMRWRTLCVLLILAAGISLRSAQFAFADYSCPPNLKYSFPNPWYIISASKYKPERPIVKQELEDLAARGDLPNAPSFYDAEFFIDVNIYSGKATYDADEKYYEDEMVCDVYSRCKVQKVEKHRCVTQPSVPVYRSIKQVSFSLVPDGKTAQWYKKPDTSPTVKMLYPNYWRPVVLDENGQPVGNYWGNKSGIHFFYSDPQSTWTFSYPSKLPEIPKANAVINPEDVNSIDGDVDNVIPVCTMWGGSTFTYDYISYNLINSDIDADPYYCVPTIGYDSTGTYIQSIHLDITDYDFDFPATFYLGVATDIAAALSPLDGKTEETGITKTKLQPSNFGTVSYLQTQFSVWMLVSTPCQTADKGCDMLNPPH